MDTAKASAPAIDRTFGLDAARFIEKGGAVFVEPFRRDVFDDVGAFGVIASLKVGECCATGFALSGNSVMDSMTLLSILLSGILYRPFARRPCKVGTRHAQRRRDNNLGGQGQQNAMN
jgi:hypothetical protein